MRKRDVSKLKVGDIIHLKHNLGGGPVTQILREPNHDCHEGRFPMIQYKNRIGYPSWCTYRVVKTVDRVRPTLHIVEQED